MQCDEPIQPVTDRIAALDALRGATLFGVLLVNLEVGFRVSLFQQMLTPHMHAGRQNYIVDLLVAAVFEFKALTLFSFLFGIGVAVQAERAAPFAKRLLARRFGVLLLIGLCHMLLVWNGDILTLYAVCGWLLLPFVALSARWLGVLGMVLILCAPYLPLFGAFFPTQEVTQSHALAATQVYANGSFAEVMQFRWYEAKRFIAPLLLATLPRTVGLMLCGMAAWRGGVIAQPSPHRALLKCVLLIAGSLGVLMTGLQFRLSETGQPKPALLAWLYPYDFVLLACAYGAGLWWWFNRTQCAFAHWLAAGGRMALSHYLMQSVIFSLLFYGFGLGLFGQLGSAVAALLGVAVFIAQLGLSDWWLRRYQFGPAEWFWRSLSYARWQPLRTVIKLESH
jgi:uncharacterized protein